MNKHRTLLIAAALAATLSLSACWDDDDDEDTVVPPPPPVVVTEVPDSAGVSAVAFFAFIRSLAANNESSEPLTIKGTFNVPADDGSEPTPFT